MEAPLLLNPPRPPGYFDLAYRDYQLQNPPRKLDHYMRALGSDSAPKDLLDIGCGLGSFLARVAARKPEWRVAGTDMNEDAVLATSTLVPSARVAQASVEDIPFPSDSFDIITAWDVIEHVPDLGAVRMAVARLLRRGGRFVFVVPVYDGPVGPAIRALDKDPTHLHKESRRFWLDWANETFVVDDWHGIFRYLVAGRWYPHVASRYIRRIAPAVLVRCRLP